MSADWNFWAVVVACVTVIISNLWKSYDTRKARKKDEKNEIKIAIELESRVKTLETDMEDIKTELDGLRLINDKIIETQTATKYIAETVAKLERKLDDLNKDIKTILREG